MPMHKILFWVAIATLLVTGLWGGVSTIEVLLGVIVIVLSIWVFDLKRENKQLRDNVQDLQDRLLAEKDEKGRWWPN